MIKGKMTYKPLKSGTIAVVLEVPGTQEILIELAPSYGKEMCLTPLQLEIAKDTIEGLTELITLTGNLHELAKGRLAIEIIKNKEGV